MRCTTPTFIVELPLLVDDYLQRFLEKAFEFGWSLYNATLTSALDCLKRMRDSQSWKDTCEMEKGPERNRRFSEIQRNYGLTEFGLKTVANNHRKASGRDQLGAHEAQCIGRTVWRALERYLFKKNGRPRYKSRKRGLNTIEGTDNHEIIYKPEKQVVYWRKHTLPVIYKETPWLREALYEQPDLAVHKRVKYCRIVRRSLNGKKRWFVQICLEGIPPVRYKYASKSEVMGIDPGPNKIACFHPQEAAIHEVAPNVDMKGKEIRLLQRKIDRSMRAMNPDNYEEDGQVKEGVHEWKVSKRCARLRAKLKEQYRVTAETRKRDHGTLANQLFRRAGTIKIEKNSYRSYQRNFGRSTQRSGMGEFVQHLKRRAASAGCVVEELNAYPLKMSQYDPFTDTCTKKPLKQRWHQLGETDTLVQRDIMSAFLACYATENRHDRSLLLSKWPAVEALLSDSGLCRKLTSCDVGSPASTKPGVKVKAKAKAEAKARIPGTGKRSVANSSGK